MKAFYEQDANLDFLKNKTIAVIGYGSQGHAHAQNLRDSGLNVIVGQRSGGANYALAKEHGFAPMSAAEAAAAADVIMILLPDQHQARVYREDIAPNLKPGKSLTGIQIIQSHNHCSSSYIHCQTTGSTSHFCGTAI